MRFEHSLYHIHEVKNPFKCDFCDEDSIPKFARKLFSKKIITLVIRPSRY